MVARALGQDGASHPALSPKPSINAAAASMENVNLGTAGNTIAGALGGVGGGQILGALVPALAAAAGGVDWKVVVGQLVGGSVGGAILTVIAGMIKNAMAKS